MESIPQEPTEGLNRPYPLIRYTLLNQFQRREGSKPTLFANLESIVISTPSKT